MGQVNDLGEKVRLLREEKGLSRPVFCGDESELSIHQLIRIEKGEFRPTIKTLERSEEHTSELQSLYDLVCRLLLEEKNQQF